MIRLITVAIALGVVLLAAGSLNARADAPHEFRWDLVNGSVVNGALVVNPGGTATAKAPDGSTATLTGAGSFEVGSESEAEGSGTFVLKDPSGTVTASGTYTVTAFVSWQLAPGSLTLFPLPVVDNIGDVEETHAGILTVTVHLYGVGDATLGVWCALPGTPDSLGITDGITLVLGGTSYARDVGLTLFHAD